MKAVLGRNCYAAYNIHQGRHQRCRVHFLRDVHEPKEKHPQDVTMFAWAASVKAIYEQAVTWATHGPDPNLSPRQQHLTRLAQQQAFEQQLTLVSQPYASTKAALQTLRKRVKRFFPELFVFVTVPGVPAHNNLAELSI